MSRRRTPITVDEHKAQRNTQIAREGKVDADAYLRAKELYESAIAELRVKVRDLQGQVREMEGEISELRARPAAQA